MKLIGADRQSHGAGLDRTPERVNYYIGNDRSRWLRGVPVFSKVKYTSVYPGIDLVYYGREKQLEYDFVVAPGADPGRIALNFTGAERMKIDASGNLVLSTARGDVVQQRPSVFQEIAGRRVEVAASYCLDEHNRVRFDIGKYDARYPLVIDPVLVYSIYIGGSTLDAVYGTAADPQGNAYVTGYTDSCDFPYNSLGGGIDHVFVVKVDGAGNPIWSTVIGGTGADVGNGIAVDPAGKAYITGQATSSADSFPHTAGFGYLTGKKTFAIQLDQNGQMFFSILYGGKGDENGVGIAVDSTGVVISGTYSTVSGADANDLPTTANALQRTFQGGSTDAFVAEFSLDGTTLQYATYLGGSGDDTGTRCAMDASGIYVVGFTGSANFPTANAVQKSLKGGYDAFAMKLTPGQSNTTLQYSTYLGGSGYDYAQGIKVLNGNAYVSGQTGSTDFPTKGAYQKTSAGGFDVFITELSPSGQIVYSTYLGGSSDDRTWDIAVDASGAVYVAGQTMSPDFPVIDSLRDVSLAVNGDAFVAKLAPSGANLLGATTLGGGAGAIGWSVAIDGNRNVYLGGETNSSDFTGASGGQTTPLYSDGVLAKIGFPNSSISSNFNGTAIPAGRTIWFTSTIFTSDVPDQGATIRVKYAKIEFQANGVTYSLPVPDAQIQFDPHAGCVSTTYGAGQWTTTANPSSQYRRTLIAAYPYTVPISFPASINPITWSGYFTADTPGMQVKWSWAAAVYTQMGSDNNSIGVKAAEANDCSFPNADQAGTPEQYRQFVTGGARGGGGSNYTGSQTQSVTVAPDVQ